MQTLRAFRDRLRADTALCAAYIARKHALIAAGVADASEYTRRKGEFFSDIAKQEPG